MAAGRPGTRPAPARTQTPPARGQRPGAPPAAPAMIKTHWATFKEPTPGQAQAQVERDNDWDGEDVAVAGQFHPTPVWDAPGAKVVGQYLGMSENRGPNNQRMYHFKNMSDGSYFDVWGATSLDNRMDDLINQGALVTNVIVRMVYLGDVPTKRGMSPTKTFDIRTKNA